MRLFGSRPRISADTPLDGARPPGPGWVASLSRSELQASIERALRILEARRVSGGYREHELQVVLQVCPAGEHYARWRKDRNRLLGRSSKRWGTSSWPERLRVNDVAIVLLPYPAGRVGPALGAATIVYKPLFINGCVEVAGALELLAMQALRIWLHETPDEDTLVLAPPVLEEIVRARPQRRRLLDCGVTSWPLAAPDGM